MKLEELKELGFESAVKKVEYKREKIRKLHIAYNNYEYVTQESIKKFNEDLCKKTRSEDQYSLQYDKLVEIPVKGYSEVPPDDVLTEFKKAKELNCFDEFVIAKIESVKEVKDPILFGKVNGCGDRFFIAQWDDDVTVEMIRNAI